MSDHSSARHTTTIGDPIAAAYEKFAHFDPLFSDEGWLEDSQMGLRMAAEMWQAIKAEMKRREAA